MRWSPQQDKALLDVSRWLNGGTKTKQVYRLWGYAGTGKTTLAKQLSESVPGKVLFAAYTGKAALILRNKGCPNASTIHKLIYTPTGNRTQTYNEIRQSIRDREKAMTVEGATEEQIARDATINKLKDLLKVEEKEAKKPRFKLNPDSELKDASLLVIDEASFVDVPMGEDLESFDKPILVLGDPAQLPPIKGFGYFINDEPDTLLTEIHRQASDNPIIHLATLARNRKAPPLGKYGESCVIRKSELKQQPHLAMQADQVICGLNATRNAGNQRIREMLGRQGQLPVCRDKLVCLRNWHEMGLLNGGLFEVLSVDAQGEQFFDLSVTSLDDAVTHHDLPSDAAYYLSDGKEGLPFWENQVFRSDFGYVLTTHKMQGSQCDNGLLIDESGSFRQDKWKHLYTGITRCAEKITIAVD